MLLGMLGFALLWLAKLPFAVLEVWWERRHGIAHTSYVAATLGGWLELGARFLLLCVALGIVMGLARLTERWWWLLAAPVFVGLLALLVFLSPYLISTRPLSEYDPALASQVAALEQKEHVGHVPVRVQKVSSDTSLPNAEAVGIGPSRRVVIWDTMLDGRFSAGEIRVVLGHELGHLARNHLVKAIGWYALFAFPEAFLIALVARRRGGMGNPAAVPPAVLVFVVFNLATLPLQNAISRRREAEADWMALQNTRDPAAAKALFRAFVPAALDDPDPPTWEYLFLQNHPTDDQRIAMVDAWRQRYATSASSAAHIP
jgi:STE24 endopeptidase